MNKLAGTGSASPTRGNGASLAASSMDLDPRAWSVIHWMCRPCPRCVNRRNVRRSRTGVSGTGSLRRLPPRAQKPDGDAEGAYEGRNVQSGHVGRVATPGVFVRADSKGVTGAFFVRADYKGLRNWESGEWRVAGGEKKRGPPHPRAMWKVIKIRDLREKQFVRP